MPCPTAKEAKLTSSPKTNATAAKVSPFAASATRRCGTAAIVARIIPVPYSELMTSTPRAPIATCAR